MGEKATVYSTLSRHLGAAEVDLSTELAQAKMVDFVEAENTPSDMSCLAPFCNGPFFEECNINIHDFQDVIIDESQTGTCVDGAPEPSIEKVIVAVFQSKKDYMNQGAFDEAMRAHGIQEGVSHFCYRVEVNTGEPLPYAQWDDPGEDCFP